MLVSQIIKMQSHGAIKTNGGPTYLASSAPGTTVAACMYMVNGAVLCHAKGRCVKLSPMMGT